MLGSVCGVDEEERFVARVPRAGGVLLIHGHEGVVSVLARRDFLERRNRRGLESLCRSREAASEEDTEEAEERVDFKLGSYALKTEIPDVSGFITSIPDEYVTETELDAKGYLTEHQSLADYSTTTQVQNMIDAAIAGITDGEAVSY